MQFLISLHINPAVLDALTDEEKAAIGTGHGSNPGQLQPVVVLRTRFSETTGRIGPDSLRHGPDSVRQGT